MKKLNLILLSALCGAILICTLGATRRGMQLGGVLGVVTEEMLAFSNITLADSSTAKHGLAMGLDGNAAHYYSGSGEWLGFDDLVRDPADAPFPPHADGEIMVRVGDYWQPLPKGDPGDVLQIGDDPSIFGADESVFWGAPSSYGLGNVSSVSDSGVADTRVCFFSNNNGRVIDDPADIYLYAPDSLYIGGDLTVNGSANVDNISAGNITMSGTLEPAGGGEINHGFYTPTLGAVANAASVTSFQAQWLRVGNTVTVSGKLTADAITSGPVSVSIALPVASNFSAEQNCAGTGAATGGAAVVYGRAANDDALLTYQSPTSGAATLFFSFTYLVQ